MIFAARFPGERCRHGNFQGGVGGLFYKGTLMDLGIKGETALVVGASEGIGYESAKGLLEEGARVLICSRSADKLKRAAAQLKKATGG